MPKYDLVIPAARKDYNKIQYLVRSAREFLSPQPENIYVVSKNHVGIDDVEWLPEYEVMPLNPVAVRHVRRPEWIYQQFIKLFLTATKNDNYFVVDSDVIFNKKIELFSEEGKTYLFQGTDQNHPPYFRVMELLLGYGREHDHTFIVDFMMFNKNISKDLLGTIEMSIEEFYHWCAIKLSDGHLLLADYEIYGQFAYKQYRNQHELKRIKDSIDGRYTEYENMEIEYKIEQMKNKDVDIFTIHTWI